MAKRGIQKTGRSNIEPASSRRDPGEENKRSRASIEVNTEIHARYKELVEGRKLVEVTSELILLFIEDQVTQKKVLRRLAAKALRKNKA